MIYRMAYPNFDADLRSEEFQLVEIMGSWTRSTTDKLPAVPLSIAD